MPKMKTSSSSKKRFELRKNGTIKYFKQNKRHILTNRSHKRKVDGRKSRTLRNRTQTKTIATLIR
jgi:large subunit ribosomal protein L35